MSVLPYEHTHKSISWRTQCTCIQFYRVSKIRLDLLKCNIEFSDKLFFVNTDCFHKRQTQIKSIYKLFFLDTYCRLVQKSKFLVSMENNFFLSFPHRKLCILCRSFVSLSVWTGIKHLQAQIHSLPLSLLLNADFPTHSPSQSSSETDGEKLHICPYWCWE